MVSCGRATGALFTTSYGDCRRRPAVRDEKASENLLRLRLRQTPGAPVRIRASHHLSPTAPQVRHRIRPSVQRHPPRWSLRQDRTVVKKDDGEGDAGGNSVVPHVADGLAQMARELPPPRVPQRPSRGHADGQAQAGDRRGRAVRGGGQPPEVSALARAARWGMPKRPTDDGADATCHDALGQVGRRAKVVHDEWTGSSWSPSACSPSSSSASPPGPADVFPVSSGGRTGSPTSPSSSW